MLLHPAAACRVQRQYDASSLCQALRAGRQLSGDGGRRIHAQGPVCCLPAQKMPPSVRLAVQGQGGVQYEPPVEL